MNILEFFKQIMQKRIYVNRGEGMLVSFSKKDNDESCLLHNTETGEEIPIIDKDGYVVFTDDSDFLMTDPHLIKYKDAISRRLPRYGRPCVDDFKNGTASVSWTLMPDGRYFEDEDGFGGTDDEEENMYAYINKHGKVVVPFQWMPSYKEAEKTLRSRAEACCLNDKS